MHINYNYWFRKKEVDPLMQNLQNHEKSLVETSWKEKRNNSIRGEVKGKAQ